MTRTARAAYPRAVLRDRSTSRSGLDSSMRKDGAGQHNWGSLADERQLEDEALEDEIREAGVEEEDEDLNALQTPNTSATIPDATASEKPELTPGKANNISEEDLEKARQYRKRALKKQGEIDLVHIARTSPAVAGSPPLSNGLTRRSGQDNKMTHASDATVSLN